jgi:hypothetical protein
MTANRLALIDWDESHVDVPDLDPVLPHNAAGLDDDAHDIAGQASAALEAAVCWDDEYAVKRLAEVRAVRAAAANRETASSVIAYVVRHSKSRSAEGEMVKTSRRALAPSTEQAHPKSASRGTDVVRVRFPPVLLR